MKIGKKTQAMAAAGALLLAGQPAKAGVLYTFDTSTLPSTQGWYYWASATSSTVPPPTESEYIPVLAPPVMAGSNTGYSVYSQILTYFIEDPLSIGIDVLQPFEVSMRARVLATEAPPTGGDNLGFSFGLFAPTGSYGIGIGTTELQTLDGTSLGAIDGTVFHDYALRVDPVSASFQLLVDGTLFASGTAQAEYLFGPYFYFGDVSSTTNAAFEIASLQIAQGVVPSAGIAVTLLGGMPLLFAARRRRRAPLAV